MTASQIMADIIGEAFFEEHKEWTCDTLKAGDADKKVSKIATCLTATPDVLRQATKWGADLIITHEPTYFNMADTPEDTPLSQKKEALIKESGATIWRYHDSMHFRGADKISLAFIERLGLKGDFDGQMSFVLDNPMTPTELCEAAGKGLGLLHPRIIGSREGLVTKLGLFLGHRSGDTYPDFMSSDKELCFSGEICEWADGEPVRSASQLGVQKTIILLGHAGSEKLGMEVLASDIDKKYDGAEARYFDCGELYSY